MSTPDLVYDTIWTGRYGDGPPVFTVARLAEEHDVTKPTMLGYLEEVEKKPGIRTTKIGQAQVYWYDAGRSAIDSSIDTDEYLKQNRRQAHEHFLLQRAKILDLREELLELSVQGEPHTETSVVLLAELSSYIISGTHWVKWENIRDPDEFESEEDYHLPAGNPLSPKEVEHYLFDVSLFSTGGREVTGVADFMQHYMIELKDLVKDEHGKAAIENAPEEELAKMLPGPRDLVAGVDAVDEFITAAHDIRW